jgi:hypothetical protein
MSNATCPNCGATLIAGAKFCRQCGRLVNTGAGTPSVTEATTRTLRTPAEYGAQPTDFFAPQPTSPAYLAPGATPQPPAYTTSNLEPKGQQRKVWLLGLIAALCFLTLIAVGIIAFTRSNTGVSQPPTATVPQPPAISNPPSPPPPPPTTGTAAFSKYTYPGAETRMNMTQANGERFLQLHTKDSFEKVFEWYRARVNPENVIRTPGLNAVLKSKDLMVVINGAGEETNIILKQGGESDFGENE